MAYTDQALRELKMQLVTGGRRPPDQVADAAARLLSGEAPERIAVLATEEKDHGAQWSVTLAAPRGLVHVEGSRQAVPEIFRGVRTLTLDETSAPTAGALKAAWIVPWNEIESVHVVDLMSVGNWDGTQSTRARYRILAGDKSVELTSGHPGVDRLVDHVLSRI